MKAKKLLTVSLLMGVMTLGACSPAHTHVADDLWHSDETKHWHECTAGDGFKMNEADHEFGQVSYVWDDDNKCAAIKGCSVCEYELTVEKVQGQYVKDTDATCLLNEKGHYVAHFTVAGLTDQATALNSHEVEDTASGHNFGGNIAYTWVEDECTASWNCQNSGCNEKQTETVKGVYVTDTPATCTENEKGHLKATFIIPDFEEQSTPANSIELPNTKLDHDFGNPEYVWVENECTATRECKRLGCDEEETETVTGSYVKDTDATCTENEKGHYFAEFSNPAFEDQETGENSVEVPGTALDHDFSDPEYVWVENECTATRECKRLECDEEETETVTGTYVKDTPATCTENEKGHFVATFTNPAFAQQETAANSYEVPDSATGHDFVSITVDGVEDSYDALEVVEGLTVTKVCSKGHEVVAEEAEVIIEYENGDCLHYGDSKFTVKIADTELELDVDVTVNQIIVEKPEADSTKFVYNQNEQEYQIPENEGYTVTGNKKTNAGTTKVVVSLVSTDYVWDDETTADVEFDFTIEKATAVISGMKESYSIACGGSLDVSGISANIGTLSVKLYDENSQEVGLTNIKGGNYLLKATVAGNDNITGAEVTAPVVSNHDATWNPVTPSADGAKIGNKTGTCKKCGSTVYTPMTHNELNVDWGFGFGTNGGSVKPSDIQNEFPEYAGSSRSAFRDWTINNTVSNVAFPRIDFTVFNNVSIVLHTNSTNQQFFGFGYNSDDDLISFADHGTHNLYSLNCMYDKENSKVIATLNDNYGDKAMFEVTDNSVITGTSSLTLKVHAGAWRQIIIDDILLNHTCSTYSEVKALKYPGVTHVCSECFTHKEPTVNKFTYDGSSFGGNANTFGFLVSNSAIKFGTDTEDVGAFKIGGDQGAVTVFDLTLPKINFAQFISTKIMFSSNAAGSLIGFDADNTVQTVANTKSDTKSTMLFEYSNGSLKVTIKTAEGKSVEKVITDANVINGCKGLTLYCSLNSWHYFAISQLVLKTVVE